MNEPRRFCSWCTPPHVDDEGGPIKADEEVLDVLCADASREVAKQLKRFADADRKGLRPDDEDARAFLDRVDQAARDDGIVSDEAWQKASAAGWAIAIALALLAGAVIVSVLLKGV